MALIKVPRAHRKNIKALENFGEVNRWASDVDARITEIILSLEQAARQIQILTTINRETTLAPHASQHLPNGSDPLATAAPTSVLGGTSSNSSGSANSFARSDHSHDVATAAPALLFDTVAADGVSNDLMRTDATVALFDGTLPANVNFAGAGTGVAGTAARRDHSHNISTAAPAFVFSTTSATGSATSAVRTNATVALFDTTTPANLGITAATGNAGKAARRDHVHTFPASIQTSTFNQFTVSDQGAGVTFTTSSGSMIFPDNTFNIGEVTDLTRLLRFEVGGISTGTLRVVTVNDADGTMVLLAGQLGGTGASPDVRGLRETGGPTLLTMGAVANGQFLTRSGTTIVGAAGGGISSTEFFLDFGTREVAFA